MKNLYLALSIIVLLFIGKISKADDIIFSMGKNPVGVPACKYKIGDRRFDGTQWKSFSFSETMLLFGNAVIVSGNNIPTNASLPTDNPAGRACINGLKHPTQYFRKTISLADPSAYNFFILNMQFDNAFVIWVNGVEAFRNNESANPSIITLAKSSICRNRARVFSIKIPTSMFVTGNNIIAVEVKLNAAKSNNQFFDIKLIGANGLTNAVLTRGPYLQVGNQTAITIRWRTDVATDSRVTWGTSFGTYTNTTDSSTLTTEHIVRISGLNPDTKYFYTIGTSTQTIQATPTNYFLTLPANNTSRKLRFLAIGDCGNASSNQVDSKNAFLNYIGSNYVDAMISLGDNAYSSGLDNEFQVEFFDIYKNDILKFYKLYQAPGNHDYGNSSSNTGVRNNAYYNSFSMPTAGEVGGLPSGTKAYYSFDVGDVHFLSLDSYGMENGNTTKLYDTLGAQCVWMKNDLASNTKKWVVVYYHHPPYTKTSHNSDTESDLIAMRENFIRIMERYGVDLVLNGHAHGYERSYLLKNFYKANAASPNTNSIDFVKANHTADSSNGKYNGTALSCAYKYNSGKYKHGSIYVVSGSAGQVGGSASGFPHKAMVYSNNTNGGCFYFEVEGNRLDAKFVSYSGTGGAVVPVIRDSFTIFKDVNKVQDIVIGANTPLDLTASWPGNYIWPNNGGATTQSVSINTSTIGTFNYIVKDANNCLKDSFHVVVTYPLATTVINFTAQQKTGIVALHWTISHESNNHFFNIEKSMDGTSWNTLGRVDGSGTSTVSHTYQLTDNNPAEGINFYRLSQTDFNNQTQVLDIKKLLYSTNLDFMVNVCNEGNGKTTLVIRNKPGGSVLIKVTDLAGREYLGTWVKIIGGNAEKSLNLNKGLYVITLTNNTGKVINNKILVQ